MGVAVPVMKVEVMKVRAAVPGVGGVGAAVPGMKVEGWGLQSQVWGWGLQCQV